MLHYICAVVRDFCECSIFSSQLRIIKGLSFLDAIAFLATQLTHEKLELFYTTLWAMWNDQNNLGHNGKYHSLSELYAFVGVFLEEFQSTQRASSLARKPIRLKLDVSFVALLGDPCF